jgi:hypothetical protein
MQVSAALTPAAAFDDWPTYHGNNQRTGYAPSLKLVAIRPRLVWNIPVDGALYAAAVVVAGGIKIVATENNTVYRLSGNRVVWARHLGAPVRRSALPCGNIDPLGITGTPAYDATTRTLIVVAELSNPIRHIAYGLDPATGARRWARTVDVPSWVPGITPTAMQQRGALIVSGRRVYVPYVALPATAVPTGAASSAWISIMHRTPRCGISRCRPLARLAFGRRQVPRRTPGAVCWSRSATVRPVRTAPPTTTAMPC